MIYIYTRHTAEHGPLDILTASLAKKFPGATIVEETVDEPTERPQMMDMLGKLKRGDVVVVNKLGWLGGPLNEIIYLIDRIMDTGAGLVVAHAKTTYYGDQGRALANVLAEFDMEDCDLVDVYGYPEFEEGEQAIDQKG
ncbi:MAG: recombinase family protein [Ktedonobacteraceae bacterium]|nr:recombinase family protein [Ktedonobacteraceae bacterium]